MQQKIAPKIGMIFPPPPAVVWFLSAKLCAQNTLFSYNPVKNFNCVVNFARWDSVVANHHMLKSEIIKRSAKMQIYKTLIRPEVRYGSETWTLTKSDENLLRIFERKILRKIYGPIQEGDIWSIRNNEELNRSINGEDIVEFIKAQRIRWLGHVKRMEEGAMPRKMMEERLFVGRRKERPRLRWMDDVVADLKAMKIKQWMEKMKDREKWRLIVGEAKAHPGL